MVVAGLVLARQTAYTESLRVRSSSSSWAFALGYRFVPVLVAARPARPPGPVAGLPTGWAAHRVPSWPAMDRSIAWRAALLQSLLVAALALLLAATLPHSFFVSWGWLAGPGSWALCALAVAAALRLPPLGVLAGAALSGLPSLVTVILGAHWLGAPLAILLFGLWCGRLGARGAARPVAA